MVILRAIYNIPVYTYVAHTAILVYWTLLAALPAALNSRFPVSQVLSEREVPAYVTLRGTRRWTNTAALLSAGFASPCSTSCGSKTFFSVHGGESADVEG